MYAALLAYCLLPTANYCLLVQWPFPSFFPLLLSPPSFPSFLPPFALERALEHQDDLVRHGQIVRDQGLHHQVEVSGVLADIEQPRLPPPSSTWSGAGCPPPSPLPPPSRPWSLTTCPRDSSGSALRPKGRSYPNDHDSRSHPAPGPGQPPQFPRRRCPSWESRRRR